MDSNDKMILTLLKEMAAADAAEAEHMTIISHLLHLQILETKQIGRASCRERV